MAIFKDVKVTEESGSLNQDERIEEGTPSEYTPLKKRILDWAKVNFGFLHFKIIKKMFGSLGDNFTTGLFYVKGAKSMIHLITF